MVILMNDNPQKLLQGPETFQERIEAVHAGLASGVPLYLMETELDWRDDAMRTPAAQESVPVEVHPPRLLHGLIWLLDRAQAFRRRIAGALARR